MTTRRERRAIACMAALAAFLCGPAPAAPAQQAPPPLESFLAADDPLPAPALSDDGRLVAYKHETTDGAALIVAPAAEPEERTRTYPDPGNCVRNMRWTGGANWLVVQTRPNCGSMGKVSRGFTVFAINAADGRLTPIAPPAPFRYRFVSSPNRPDIVAVLRDKRDPNATTIDYVDLANDTRWQETVPAGTTRIYLDRRLDARLIAERSEDGGFRLQAKQPGGQWRQVGLYDNAERDGFKVLGFLVNGEAAILIDTLGRDRAAAVRLDLATGDREVLFSHPRWQPVDAVLDATRGRLRAVQVHGHRRRWEAIDAGLSAAFEALAGLGDVDVSVLSRSADDRIWLVAVDADRTPRRYGLLDRARDAFVYLPDAGDDTGRGRYRGKTPIEFAARDGLRLTGYLTLPASHRGRAVPMVQRVHGGPVLRHTWAFDPTTQWLASRGYAVLEVNFHGSGGFGPAWQRQGYGEWGRRMQQDLNDAVGWAVDRGIALPDRVAVMGHSYGGYAALMGLATRPHRYACGIGLSAPSDLPLFLQTLRRFGSLAKTRSQRAFVASQIARYETELGHPGTDLDAVSPLALAERIERPVLLFHGQADRGVLPAHSETLFKRLDTFGRTAALIRFANEGHRIRRRDNRLAMMSLTERFLSSCLGGAHDDEAANVRANEAITVVATRRFKRTFGQLIPAAPAAKPEKN